MPRKRVAVGLGEDEFVMALALFFGVDEIVVAQLTRGEAIHWFAFAIGEGIEHVGQGGYE